MTFPEQKELFVPIYDKYPSMIKEAMASKAVSAKLSNTEKQRLRKSYQACKRKYDFR